MFIFYQSLHSPISLSSSYTTSFFIYLSSDLSIDSSITINLNNSLSIYSSHYSFLISLPSLLISLSFPPLRYSSLSIFLLTFFLSVFPFTYFSLFLFTLLPLFIYLSIIIYLNSFLSILIFLFLSLLIS